MDHSPLSTRETILATARELFFKNGYDTTSVQDIIRVLGISKGGIYHHFASKDEILSELIQKEASPLMEGAKKIFENPKLLIQAKFIAWIDMKNTFYEEKYGILRQVFVESTDLSLRFRIINILKQNIKPVVEKAIAESKEDMPKIKEIANLLLCAHELVFSYGLSEIKDEKEFHDYLETIKYLAIKVFA